MNKYCTRWVVVALVLINVCSANELRNDLFSNPKLVSSKEVLELLDSKYLDMSWYVGENDFFHFISKKNNVYFEIRFESLPECYGSIKDLFVEEIEFIEGKETKYHVFSFERKIDGKNMVNQPRKQEKTEGSNASSYIVDQRRIFDRSYPQLIAKKEIVSIICGSNVLFYTGAGLSVASGVPSMNQLNNLLGLKEGKEPFINSLKYICIHPEEFVEKVRVFHQACFFSPPSEAHQALKELALFKNTKIVTENLDCLHEYSGILPYRINAEQLRAEIDSSQLLQIQYIICIGLSHDEGIFRLV